MAKRSRIALVNVFEEGTVFRFDMEKMVSRGDGIFVMSDVHLSIF
jgi:hypothetical protein